MNSDLAQDVGELYRFMELVLNQFPNFTGEITFGCEDGAVLWVDTIGQGADELLEVLSADDPGDVRLPTSGRARETEG